MISKEIIKNACEFYDIEDTEYINKCYDCFEYINCNSDFKIKVYDVYNILYNDKTDKKEKLWNIKKLDDLFGKEYNKYVTNVLLLSGYEIHINNMLKYSFDDIQMNIHKKRVKEALVSDIYEKHYDGIRISQMLWGTYFINIKIIEIGRLQYEFYHYNIATNKRENCIKIHIPKGEKLDIDEIKKSLLTSREPIKKYFNLDNFDYICKSWLLSKEIRNMLNEDSNINKFQNLFKVTEGNECIDDILNFVYNTNECKDYHYLTEETSLQKKVKELLINGETIHIGIGVLNKS